MVRVPPDLSNLMLHCETFSALFSRLDMISVYNAVQVPLPSGGILTPHGLQLLGLSGLGSAGGFERLHYM
jgi:hypothetical protein